MSQLYTFHKSAIGYSHVERNIPCEDASASYSSEDGRYHIAIISDGHGQALSFRSNIGSQIAVDTAMECLKSFAETILSDPGREDRFYLDILSNPRYRQMTMRQQSDTILAMWSDRIHSHYKENLPTEEELGQYVDYFKEEERIPEIYGATLIAVLMLPKCILFFHQGDGRCDVFYSDGSVDQPIPWDDRCEGNRTTSLCDDDSADSFRHHVIDTSKKQVVACYVGSDGVEDAYRSQEGTHTFYRELSCMLIELKDNDLEDRLSEFLSNFSAYGLYSKVGSLDDVSVAGILDLEAITGLIPLFKTEIQKYELNEKLFWKQDELRSKTRGHGILRKRKEESAEKLEQAIKFLRMLEAERDELVSQREALIVQIQKTSSELQEGQSASDHLQSNDESGKEVLRTLRQFCEVALQNLIDDFTSAFASKQDQHQKMLTKRDELTEAIQAKNSAILNAEKNIEILRSQRDQDATTFAEYDAKYQAISEEIDELIKEIASSSTGDV